MDELLRNTPQRFHSVVVVVRDKERFLNSKSIGYVFYIYKLFRSPVHVSIINLTHIFVHFSKKYFRSKIKSRVNSICVTMRVAALHSCGQTNSLDKLPCSDASALHFYSFPVNLYFIYLGLFLRA